MLHMLVPEFPPFMLDVVEVVDSSAESPKCVATRIGQEPEASARNCRNRTLRFGKSDYPILLIPAAVKCAAGTRRGNVGLV
jgi:hypothetical protein